MASGLDRCVRKIGILFFGRIAAETQSLIQSRETDRTQPEARHGLEKSQGKDPHLEWNRLWADAATQVFLAKATVFPYSFFGRPPG